MFIRITEGTVADRKARVKNDIVEVDDKEGQFLINIKKAEVAVEKQEKPKTKSTKKTKVKE